MARDDLLAGLELGWRAPDQPHEQAESHHAWLVPVALPVAPGAHHDALVRVTVHVDAGCGVGGAQAGGNVGVELLGEGGVPGLVVGWRVASLKACRMPMPPRVNNGDLLCRRALRTTMHLSVRWQGRKQSQPCLGTDGGSLSGS